MRILNTSQMREADQRTITQMGVPAMRLMEHAGRAVVATMLQRWPAIGESRVAIVCGRGNNGGDGFVVARLLALRGSDVCVYLGGRSDQLDGAARTNLLALASYDVPVHEVFESSAWRASFPEVTSSDVIVDALFGTGLTRPLGEPWITMVRDLNNLNVPIVAIDLPSGLCGDTAELIGEAIDAEVTVALGALKPPLVVTPGSMQAGEVVVADIGIPARVIDGLDRPVTSLSTRADAAGFLKARARDIHKGDCGRVLIVAGSARKSGAARLAAAGALRSGAGLVTVATPRGCQQTVSAWMPEYMTLGLEETPLGEVAAGAAELVLEQRCDVLAVGPGLGQGPDVELLVRTLVERTAASLVLDADALNVCARDATTLVGRDGRDLIITPHPGEMARLVGISVEDVQTHRIEVARDFAMERQIHVVLKGAGTVVATPGGEVWVNATGNPGMATGGAGDVLTGMVAAWLAQLVDADAACRVAACLHGIAGDLAAAAKSQPGLIASDIVNYLGDGVLALLDRQSGEERYDAHGLCALTGNV